MIGIELNRLGHGSRASALLAVLAAVLVGCGSVESTLQNAASRIDTAFGVEPKARYDLLTDQDIELAVATMQQALETRGDGDNVRWENADSGNSGAVTPVATFVTDKGVFCRNYRETVFISDKQGTSENTSCRDDDGTWAWVL